jgi:hypothetical protein
MFATKGIVCTAEMPLGRSILGRVNRHRIVEGEPGIFPDPIARLYRWIGRMVLRLLGRTPR